MKPITEQQAKDYEIDEEWMNATLGSFVATEISTNSLVATQTENTGHKFTEQQIEDFCAELREFATTSLCCTRDGYVLLQQAVQIIRQLQGCQTTSPAKIVEPGAS